jgi:hypothetical protein
MCGVQKLNANYLCLSCALAVCISLIFQNGKSKCTWFLKTFSYPHMRYVGLYRHLYPSRFSLLFTCPFSPKLLMKTLMAFAASASSKLWIALYETHTSTNMYCFRPRSIHTVRSLDYLCNYVPLALRYTNFERSITEKKRDTMSSAIYGSPTPSVFSQHAST